MNFQYFINKCVGDDRLTYSMGQSKSYLLLKTLFFICSSAYRTLIFDLKENEGGLRVPLRFQFSFPHVISAYVIHNECNIVSDPYSGSCLSYDTFLYLWIFCSLLTSKSASQTRQISTWERSPKRKLNKAKKKKRSPMMNQNLRRCKKHIKRSP